ncbi:DUF1071 domain-containing protein [Glaciimonas sp. CA11.2]|uniref:Sak single strand annealing protein n=1 Tax=Glaciimonas sp. CA11.2 TaxID=3048601 RepID=UPI002AB4A384|nr:DUF1071 domain-containing protein [Glaciimonas sp. CA11.2]MDY7546734.1 DUF1071 domain-containing protein [Glaciimonas sp. CA11.2]MEB0162891.1 DUF1071 domain-containing protein [Glaciimonas sp. CA11.2]
MNLSQSSGQSFIAHYNTLPIFRSPGVLHSNVSLLESIMQSHTINYFSRLNAIDVSDHIEKKGGFSYLSWPYAVAQLRTADPTATWEVRRFDGLPFLATESGVFVEVAVTVQGITLSQIHPVLDGRNRPILAPTAFEINSSIQRCLVKAIALHGLGLYIYAGEDLPQPITTDIPAANDGNASGPKPAALVVKKNKPVSITINATQQALIRKLALEVGTEIERVFAYFGVQDLSDIPSAEYSRVIRSLEKRRAA